MRRLMVFMTLLAISFVSWGQRPGGLPPVPIGQAGIIQVNIQNGFLMENVSVRANGQIMGVVGGNQTRSFYVPQGCFLHVMPDISGPGSTTAWQQGTYRAYPPCFLCPARVEYIGE